MASAASASTNAAKIVEVRLAMSQAAGARLNEAHERRLLEIELQDNAVVAPGAGGPLGDYVAYVWMDLPTDASVAIEVRVGDRPVARREVAIKGLIGDVAARLAAIAASEMIRAQMAPGKPAKKPPPAPQPSLAEREAPLRRQATPVGTIGALAVALPSAHGAVAGPDLALGFRAYGLAERLFASWLTGSTRAGEARFLEVGVGADYRAWLGHDARFVFGGEAAMASVHFADVDVDDEKGARDTWSARANARVGFEARVAAPAWLAVSVAPGILLRPIPFGPADENQHVQGAWIGVDVALVLERSTALPPPAPPSPSP